MAGVVDPYEHRPASVADRREETSGTGAAADRSAAATVLNLQRLVGNSAVSTALQRSDPEEDAAEDGAPAGGRALGASAYAGGQQIGGFAAGDRSTELLGHEMTHTAQQGVQSPFGAEEE